MKNRKRKVREDNSSDHDDDDDDEDDDEGCGSSSSDDEEDMRSWYKPGGAAEAAEQNDGKQKEGQEDQKDQDDPNFDASDPKQVARFRRKHKTRVDGWFQLSLMCVSKRLIVACPQFQQDSSAVAEAPATHSLHPCMTLLRRTSRPKRAPANSLF